MLLADTLVVIGMATLQLGTIQEADGVQERTFWLRNDGPQAVALTQGYTSCHCTTIRFDSAKTVAPGDSTAVTLSFNPQGKGGEFYESGTVVYGPQAKRVTVAFEGECITSEETLIRQFPVRVNDDVRLSTNRLDLGIMHVGETKERNIVVLYQREGNRREVQTVRLSVTQDTPKGLQHMAYPLEIRLANGTLRTEITLDVLVK